MQKEVIKENAADQGGETSLPAGEMEGQNRHKEIQGSDQVGAAGSLSAGSSGLAEKGEGVESLCQTKRFEPISEEQNRIKSKNKKLLLNYVFSRINILLYLKK